ncbi:GTP cyclohydrolase [Nocardia cyriacigeorgica]|uniref:GTP cyclohydrolase n=1 Tax=Nocardia cyriacigeorgica TaxID=135487 RepID=UPI002490DF32|nr:GTP cyclohydrolase [Nocardia cyriacigeorgica]BDU04493.1 hypothetical protein FMUBM48_07560 [Nocardia cyriacigeorgica]
MSGALFDDLDASAHRLRRRGHDLPVRVSELADHGRGIGHLIVIGAPTAGALVRIQSRCLYADLGWDDTDSAHRLTAALDCIQDVGAGVLVYLEQDGRGHGLTGLARHLHITQNRPEPDPAPRLTDLRSYSHAATAVAGLGLGSVRLLTDNPAKTAALLRAGVDVTPISLRHNTRRQQATTRRADDSPPATHPHRRLTDEHSEDPQ